MYSFVHFFFFFTIPRRDVLSHPCKWQLQSSAIEVFFIVTASHKMCPTSLWRPYAPAASSSRILRLCSPNIRPGLASKTICNVTNHTCRPLKIKLFLWSQGNAFVSAIRPRGVRLIILHRGAQMFTRLPLTGDFNSVFIWKRKKKRKLF